MKHLTETELVMALDGELEPDELQRAVEHLAECDACRGEWERLQATSEMVAEYQKSLYPPDWVAATPRDSAPVSRFKLHVARWQWGFAAVAAMVMLAVGVSWYANGHDSQPSANNRPRVGAPSDVVEQQNSRSFVPPRQQELAGTPFAKNAPQDDRNNLPGKNTSRATGKKANARSFVAKNAPQDDKSNVVANQYTELPFSDSSLPLNDATVVRVSMPASVLRQAGVPVSEDNATAMLQADVVLGIDGLPRGIRLVKNTVANQVGTN